MWPPPTFSRLRSKTAPIQDGAQLIPTVVDDAPLDPGEHAYAQLHAHGWRYVAVDVVYERMMLLAGGGFLMTLTGLTSVVPNRRRR